MKSALISGINGQDASYLAEFLLGKNYQVYGTIRRSSSVNTERIAHLLDKITLIPADLTDSTSLITALHLSEPDEVYNLAAQSFVPASLTQPIMTGEITGLGVTRVLDAIRTVNPAIRFYQASTSEMFGKAKISPQNEDTPFRPRSPYGVAKVYGHYITINYRESYGLHASSGILFNHESPRRSVEFVTRKVTMAVAKIRLGLQKELRMGNLDSMRDWGFAGDYVQAMWLMLQQDTPDDYVIASGKMHSVQDLVDIAFSRCGMEWRDYVIQDPEFMRPVESDLLQGDFSKAQKVLGWKPKTSFKQLIEMMVESDFERLYTHAK